LIKQPLMSSWSSLTEIFCSLAIIDAETPEKVGSGSFMI
jgi:hypothetical protein